MCGIVGRSAPGAGDTVGVIGCWSGGDVYAGVCGEVWLWFGNCLDGVLMVG